MVEFSQKQAHRNSVKLLQTNAGVWSDFGGYRKFLKIFPNLQRIKTPYANTDWGVSYTARKLKLFCKCRF